MIEIAAIVVGVLAAVVAAGVAGVTYGRRVAEDRAEEERRAAEVEALRDSLVGRSIAVVTREPDGETYRGTLRNELDDALRSGWIVLRDVQVLSPSGNQAIGGIVRIPVATVGTVQDFVPSSEPRAVVSK